MLCHEIYFIIIIFFFLLSCPYILIFSHVMDHFVLKLIIVHQSQGRCLAPVIHVTYLAKTGNFNWSAGVYIEHWMRTDQLETLNLNQQ